MPETLPLKPIEPDFKDKVAANLATRDTVAKLVDDVVAKGLRNVFFVGCGGSLIASYPAHFALERYAPFPVFRVQSDELNHARHAQLGEGSLVVLASHTGTTKETVAAAGVAKAAGATVVTIAKADSPLAQAGDVTFATEHSDIQEALIAYTLLAKVGAPLDNEAVRAAFDALPDALLSAVHESEDLLHGIAVALKDEPITYVLGSGPSQGWAYGLSMCYLQEMQWMHAASFNSGEFFHGAFEVVNDDVPVVLLLGEDVTRPMGERAKTFLEKYTKKAHYIDVRPLSLPGVPAEARGEVSPLVIAALISRLARHYESVRGHDLEQRHYMFQVEY